MDHGSDSVTNCIYLGIKRAIKVCLENECYGAATILVYSGIDTMAYLGMPDGQQDVSRKDFVTWVERYIRIPAAEKLSGLDLYGARCALLHSHAAESSLSRKGECRLVLYADRLSTPVIYNAAIDPGVVMVSLEALANAFFAGIDIFLIDLFANKPKAAIAERRLEKLLKVIPFVPSPRHLP